MANQLKLQSVAKNQADATASKKVKSDLQALDDQIKGGDAKKAEAALAVAKKDLNASQADNQSSDKNDPQNGGQSFRSFLAYA